MATINDNTPTFTWNAVSDTTSNPVTYVLLVDTENSFSSPRTITELSLSSPTFTSGTIPDGTYFWKVKVRDAAGNAGAFSSTQSFTVDTIAPNTILNSAIDGNTNPVTNNSITKSNSITFTFSGTPASDVNHFVCTLDSPTEIDPCVSPKQFTGLSETTHTVTIAAVDASGNKDQTPITFKWTVDTTAPDAPVITSPTASPPPRNTAIDEISGTSGEEGLTIEVIDATLGSLGTTTSTTGGDWTLTLGTSLGEGTYIFTANATDAAGNPGPASSAVDVTVDTTAPDVPVITSPTDGATLNTAITQISGTSEAEGLEIEVIDATLGSLGTTTSTTGGDWTLTLGTSLGDGSYTFTATASDGVNTSPTSAPVNVLVQTAPTTIETSMSLQLSSNKATPGAGFTASGKLINTIADAPIAGQEISVTINGLSPVTATTV